MASMAVSREQRVQKLGRVAQELGRVAQELRLWTKGIRVDGKHKLAISLELAYEAIRRRQCGGTGGVG